MASRCIVVAWLLASACGSKTAIEVGEPTAEDAGFDGFDAGFDAVVDVGVDAVDVGPDAFPPLPCQWNYRGDVALNFYRGTLLEGAVSPFGPTAMVVALTTPDVREVPAADTAFGIRVSDTPTVEWMTEVPTDGLGVYATEESFRRVRFCELEVWNLDGRRSGAFPIEGCPPGGADFTSDAFEGQASYWENDALHVFELANGAEVDRFPLPGAGEGVPVLTPEGAALLLFGDPVRARYPGMPAFPVVEEEGRGLHPTPYRSRGGVVINWTLRDRPRLAYTERSGFVQDYDLFELGPERSVSPVAIHETTAIFVLERGQVVVLPLEGGPIQFLPPLSPRVRRARVLLIDGTRAGGIAYVRAGEGPDQLRFRSMVCVDAV
ncbi:MAG: hypothetical protein AAGE52_17115 [Myxococcota bacterium]